MRSALTAQHSHWVPATRAGRWALTLASASVLGLALSAVGFATGVLESASSFSADPLLTGWGAAILGAAAASVAAGAFAIARRHERSWTVLAATCLGLLVTVVLLNEVAQGL